MTETPPPPPEQEPQLPDMISLPLKHIKTVARLYTENGWLVRMLARMAGQKVPRELDEFFKEIMEDQPNPEKIQEIGLGKDPYNIQQQEIPEPRIGEPVLTRDLAWRAWQLHHEQGLSLREIAAYFTQELGAPCSHATIANYINEIDEVMEESRGARTKTVLKYAALIGVPFVCALLVGHFFL